MISGSYALMALLSLIPMCCSSESSIDQVGPYYLRRAGKKLSAATQNLMASHEGLTRKVIDRGRTRRVGAFQIFTQVRPTISDKEICSPTSLDRNGYLLIMVNHLSMPSRGATSEDHHEWLVLSSFSRASSTRFRHRFVFGCRSRSGLSISPWR